VSINMHETTGKPDGLMVERTSDRYLADALNARYIVHRVEYKPTVNWAAVVDVMGSRTHRSRSATELR
jgi:hypothetical protein